MDGDRIYVNWLDGYELLCTAPMRILLMDDCDMPYVYSRANDLGVTALLMEVLGRLNDTDPQIADIVCRRLLERSRAERMLMGSRMFDAAKLWCWPPSRRGLAKLKSKRVCASGGMAMRLTRVPFFST